MVYFFVHFLNFIFLRFIFQFPFLAELTKISLGGRFFSNIGKKNGGKIFSKISDATGRGVYPNLTVVVSKVL